MDNNPTRRSGSVRRQRSSTFDANRRQDPERRSVAKDIDTLIQSLDTIQLFSGLTREQYRKLIYICYEKNYPAGHVLFREGDKADAFYVLMSGELNILRADTLVQHVFPVGIVGEVGVFSGKEHLTSTIVARDSELIQINRTELFRLFRNDNRLCNRILFNVIQEIASKLREYNEFIEDLQAMSRNIFV